MDANDIVTRILLLQVNAFQEYRPALGQDKFSK